VIDAPITAAMVRGATELEPTSRGVRPHRLPTWARQRFPDPQLLLMEAQASGVRLVLVTTSRRIELDVRPHRLAYRGAERPRGAIDLVLDGEVTASTTLTGGDVTLVDLRTGSAELLPGADHTAAFPDLPPGEKVVELWLPHNESVELLALRGDAPIAASPTRRPVWLHHGSSISHGSNAASPTRIWPAVAARRGGVDLQNLGLGGNALVDPFTAQVMRDTPADLISIKLGINVVNLDSMRLRAFVPAVHGFLDLVREGHPTTPIVLISPIFCGIHEDTPGPGAVAPETFGTSAVRFIATGRPEDVATGRLTLRVIREALQGVVATRSDDPNLVLLDGLELYGEADAAAHPLPDALHPDTETHANIGERFAGFAFGAGGPFAERSARSPR
jgi:hypothetical protein